ncbi:MAG: deoxyribonuclease IV [Fimbriimonadaceae bacterium]
MAAKYIGAHMPIKDGLGSALRLAKKICCTAIQVFTSSPKTWYAPAISVEQVADFKKAKVETGIGQILCHDSYLHNICGSDVDMARKSIDSLKREIERCSLYGIPYLVTHLGAHKGQGEAIGLTKAAEAIEEILKDTPGDVMLLMETTAAQGTDLNGRFEHLAMLLELCKGHPRLGVCADTCHIFVAGYDIRTPETWDKTWALFDMLVGFKNLKACHCNDSKGGLGSKIDRHEHIGQGLLGEATFRLLVNDPRFEDIPIVLETNEPETMHAANIAKLRSLCNH